MKIQITEGDRNRSIMLPTHMLFSKTVLRLICISGRFCGADALAGISPKAMDAIFRELRRTKERYGDWELVDVESREGEKVKIIL